MPRAHRYPVTVLPSRVLIPPESGRGLQNKGHECCDSSTARCPRGNRWQARKQETGDGDNREHFDADEQGQQRVVLVPDVKAPSAVLASSVHMVLRSLDEAVPLVKTWFALSADA